MNGRAGIDQTVLFLFPPLTFGNKVKRAEKGSILLKEKEDESSYSKMKCKILQKKNYRKKSVEK